MNVMGPLTIDEDSTRRYLTKHNWPSSLQNVFIKGCQRFPVRYFIVDDSGSMAKNDGHRRIENGNANKLVPCSRWAEVTDALRFHAGLAEAVGIPTEFRLLNGAPPMIVGEGTDDGAAYKQLNEILDRSPGGATPLCRHVSEVIDRLKAVEDRLRANAQKAVIIIMTDGDASDGNMAEAMALLENLPVWVVVRLCTDEEDIGTYWNSIDQQLELEIDVLDDLVGEAKEVHKHNKWLTYGEPLHRLREWGVQVKEMDLIDEATLAPEQMRAVCAMLYFNGDNNALPHPDANWESFVQTLDTAIKQEGTVWDPIKTVQHPWIRTEKLVKTYHPESAPKCTVM